MPASCRRSASIARADALAHPLQQARADRAVGRLCPGADHAPVGPDRRPGIAVAIEQLLGVGAQVPLASLPPHRRGVERRQQRDPVAGRLPRPRGRRAAPTPGSGSDASRTSTAPIADKVEVASRAVQPVHHRTSVMVAGPKARSQRRSRLAHASDGGIGSMPPSIHRSKGAHRYWPDVHDPSGRARTMRPSVASRNNTRVDRPTVPPQVFPCPTVSFVASSGTSAVSSRAVASPRVVSAAMVRAETSSSHASASSAATCSASMADEPPPLGRHQRLRARRVDDADERARHDEQGPPHPQHAHERAPLVERVLEVCRVEAVDPRPGRQEDRRRVARVQADEIGCHHLDRTRSAAPDGGARRGARGVPRSRTSSRQHHRSPAVDGRPVSWRP